MGKWSLDAGACLELSASRGRRTAYVTGVGVVEHHKSGLEPKKDDLQPDPPISPQAMIPAGRGRIAVAPVAWAGSEASASLLTRLAAHLRRRSGSPHREHPAATAWNDRPLLLLSPPVLKSRKLLFEIPLLSGHR